MKKRTGTGEWSDQSINLGIGCSHNCRYCYAKEIHLRFKRVRQPADWPHEHLKPEWPPVPRDATVMFPTTHDLSPHYLPAALRMIGQLLDRHNRVLLVSKPHEKCIKRICAEFGAARPRLLFRFSIGSLDQKLADFWEPGAPALQERLACLEYAFHQGFRTSVSMEPFLGDIADAERTFFRVQQHATGYVWVGAMKSVRRRVAPDSPAVERRCDEIIAQQSAGELLKLVAALGPHPKVRWKDSISDLLRTPSCRREPALGFLRGQLKTGAAAFAHEWN